MITIQSILRQAARRDFINRGLEGAGWGLLVAGILAVVMLGIDRLAGIGLPWRLYPIVTGVGLVAGAIRGYFTRPDRLTLAVQLDRRLRLKDRIGTALAVSQRNTRHDEAFAELVEREARQLAETIDVRAATPIRITGVWSAAVSLLLLAAAGLLWMPTIDRNSGESKADVARLAQSSQQRLEQSKEIAESIRKTIGSLPNDQRLDESTLNDLNALDRLTDQLADARVSDEELIKKRDESAARLNEVAERMAEQSRQELAASDELARRFAGLDATDAPKPPMSIEEFSKALKRGDFGRAAEQLEELLDDKTMSEAERRAAAQHLRDLAGKVDEAAQTNPDDVGELREQVSQALHDQGLDQRTIDDFLDRQPDSLQKLQEEFAKRNIDEDVAEEMAREAQNIQEGLKTQEQVEKDARDVAQSLDRAAQQIEQPREAAEPSSTQPQDAADNEAPRPSTQAPAATQPRTSDRPRESTPKSDRDRPSSPSDSQSDQAQQHDALDKEQQQSNQESRQQSKQGTTANQTQGKDQQSTNQGIKQPQSNPDGSGPKSDRQQSATRTTPASQPDESLRQGSASQPSGQSPSSQDEQRSNHERSEPSKQGEQRNSSRQPQSGQSESQSSPSKTDKSRNGSQAKQDGVKQGQSTQDQAKQSQQQDQQSQQDQQGQQQDGTAQRTQDQKMNPGKPASSQPGKSGDQERQEVARPDPDQTTPRSVQPGGSMRPDTSDSVDQSGRRDSSRNDQMRQSQPHPGDAQPSGSPQDQSQQSNDLAQNQTIEPQGDRSADQSPSDALRRLAERRENAKGRQQTSERMREAAQELAEKMSPEERRQWAQQWQRQEGGESAGGQPNSPRASGEQYQPPTSDSQFAGDRTGDRQGTRSGDRQGTQSETGSPERLASSDTDEVDLRGGETADQLIMKWFTETPQSGHESGPRGSAANDAGTQRVRRVQDVAERAVNDAAVQKRYHKTIKRYFGKLNQTIEKAAGAPSAAAPADEPATPQQPARSSDSKPPRSGN